MGGGASVGGYNVAWSILMYSSTIHYWNTEPVLWTGLIFLPTSRIKSLFVRQTEGYCGRRAYTWAKARRKAVMIRQWTFHETHSHTHLVHKKRCIQSRPPMHGFSDVCSMDFFSLSHIHFSVSTKSAITPLRLTPVTLSRWTMTLNHHHTCKPPPYPAPLCASDLKMNFRGPREGWELRRVVGWGGGVEVKSERSDSW